MTTLYHLVLPPHQIPSTSLFLVTLHSKISNLMNLWDEWKGPRGRWILLGLKMIEARQWDE
jgi:hypothetical protein